MDTMALHLKSAGGCQPLCDVSVQASDQTRIVDRCGHVTWDGRGLLVRHNGQESMFPLPSDRDLENEDVVQGYRAYLSKAWEREARRFHLTDGVPSIGWPVF